MHVIKSKPSTSFIAVAVVLGVSGTNRSGAQVVRNPTFQSDTSLDLPCMTHLNPQATKIAHLTPQATQMGSTACPTPAPYRRDRPGTCDRPGTPPESANRNNCCSSCMSHSSAVMLGLLIGLALVLVWMYKDIILNELGFVDYTSSVPSNNVTSPTLTNVT